MNELEQLLVANELTDEQRSKIRAYFRGVDTFAEIRPVAIEPTIRQSIVLHEPTVLVTEDDSRETSTEPNPNRVDGPRIGRYFDLGLLGKGGMGEIFMAEDPICQRTIARTP